MSRPGKRRARTFIILAAAAIVAFGLVAAFSRLPQQQEKRPTSPTRWDLAQQLRSVHHALGERDVKGALMAWQVAYAGALESPRWEALIEVGDAYLSIGDAAEYRRAFIPKARESYALALARAHQASSIQGVLRASKAIASLE